MDSLNELQVVMEMLGTNIKVIPRLAFFSQVKTSDNQLVNSEDMVIQNKVQRPDKNLVNMLLQTSVKSTSARLKDCRINLVKQIVDEELFNGVNDCIEGESVRSHEKYQCMECSSAFSRSWDLGRHIQNKHSFEPDAIQAKKKSRKNSKPSKLKLKDGKIKIYECSKCDKTFNHKISRDRHVERTHDGVQYCCGVCNHITGFKSSMKNHCMNFGHDDSLILKVVDFPPEHSSL